MASVAKLIEKMKNQPHGITLAEAERVMTAKGFHLARSKGSHRVFSDGKGKRLSIPEHGAVIKRVYVEKLLELIGEEK